jgi:type IV pilus assembly protein PilW
MKRSQLGLSIIELLVALAIGSFLIIGAVTVQSQTRKTFTVNEQQARLQETARYVLSVIEPEVQLAGLYGYSNQSAGVKWDKGDGSRPISAKEMRTSKSAVDGIPAVFDECGTNEVLDVNAPISATDGAWTLGCASNGGGMIPGTDTLTIRRTSVEKVDPVDGRLQLYTNRLKPDNQTIILNGIPPHPLEDHISEIRDLLMRTFYVAQDSEGRPNLPSMRVKQISFDDDKGEGAWDDQEVVRGVEDVQIELGIDPGDPNSDGTIQKEDGMASFVNGNVGRYVKPGDAIVSSGQVVTVRIWVRVRAEDPEPGFRDGRVYNYASVKDFQPNDNYRRVLMSRTIFLRNSRSFPTS